MIQQNFPLVFIYIVSLSLFSLYLQSETNRYCIPHFLRFSTLPARFPFRHQSYYPKGFFVQLRIQSPQYHRMKNVSFFIHHKLHNNPRSSARFRHKCLVIVQVLPNKIHQSRHTSGKLGHLLYLVIRNIHILFLCHYLQRL